MVVDTTTTKLLTVLGAVVVVVLVGRAAVLGVVEAHVLVRLYVGKKESTNKCEA